MTVVINKVLPGSKNDYLLIHIDKRPGILPIFTGSTDRFNELFPTQDILPKKMQDFSSLSTILSHHGN
jgi:hypothetical protein